MIRRFVPLALMTFVLVAGAASAMADAPAEAAAQPSAFAKGNGGTGANDTKQAAGEAPSMFGPIRDMAKNRTGDLDELEEARVVRILTVHSPGRFYLEEGRGRGIVAEMAARYEDFLNKQLGKGHVKVYVVVVPVARDQLIPALLAGRGDLVSAGLTITPERQELVDFSIPASKPLNEILVTGPSAPEVKTLEDLSGELVYLREDSSYRESVERLNRRFEEKGLEPILIKAMPGSLEDDDLIEMVNAGLLPWAVVDDYKPQLWKGVFRNIRVRDDLVFREGGRIAWAMRKNSPKLKASIDAFLKDNREGTLIGNILRNRYIRDFDWAASALDEEDYQRFNELEEYFRRYGDRYEIEYLFAAAQGYQESRLDQNVRSAAGAIGVMQLLPTTAADRNVAIPDIQDVENNIHAGIKYLDFLRNRYFSDPEINPLNQALLALAAYNAGPSRMIGMRDRAAARGYDPNVWFDNVELIAAEEIGRETVQYVSNIFRYYLTYRMIANQELRHAAARRQMGLSDAPDL
ncbi:MAG: lytic transglycosylase F [Halieaceae bacterium]|jgi:membrane-bound lytic murein transglycosylase MltF|nr:lytic transglycosylase F [Halieaceae bacterium]